MSEWLHHPSYARQRDALIELFRENVYTFPKLRPVVFLCGAVGSQSRDRIAQYLRERTKSLVFYADEVWARLASEDLNALQMEDHFAELSDIVIIVVESPGTYCELGAFSLSPSLRRKLLPLIDTSYRNVPSFINTGPVRWINKESEFAPALYGDHKIILSLMPEIEKRMVFLRFRGTQQVSNIAQSPKHLLFLICDLVAIIGPASIDDIRYYLEKIVNDLPVGDVAEILGVAVSLKLVSEHSPYFYCDLNEGEIHEFRRKKALSPAHERAKFLGVFQTIPRANVVLNQITAPIC